MKGIHSRRALLIFIDAETLLICSLISVFLYNMLSVERLVWSQTVRSMLLFVVTNMVLFGGVGIYRRIWRYANVKDMLVLMFSLLVGSTASVLVMYLIGRRDQGVLLLLSSMLSFSAVLGLRLLYQFSTAQRHRSKSSAPRERIMIVGSGLACRNLLSELATADNNYEPVCIVNNISDKFGRRMQGVPVYGPIERIPELCNELQIKTILFALASYDDVERERVRNICTHTNCLVKVVPYLSETSVDTDTLSSNSGEVNIETLLGRKAVLFDNQEVREFVHGEVCMVTGGGGSIGSELCRQIAKYKPRHLIVLDIYENNAYEIQQELLRQYGSALNLSVQIASVRDYHKMDQIFRAFRPTVVFHAAAHKHVPLMETNPEEAVKNNIIGTYQVAQLSSHYQVKKFVLVSTDKAVNPTNVMGATKRCCEMIMQYMTEQKSATDFVTVRFGNVLGSNGSVIPLFKKQIEAGGPVTVTHPDIIRYFMTIPEAVSLILQAGAMARGGEIFVLDMGAPVRIVTLAENLIRQYGKEPHRDIEIQFSGLRPGEKLFEELLMSEEGLQSTMNNKIFIGSQIPVDADEFDRHIRSLGDAADVGDTQAIIQRLHVMVPTFTHKEIPKTVAAKPAEESMARCSAV